jgi:16S rRNA (cytosine967-C5)-methyltransferase
VERQRDGAQGPVVVSEAVRSKKQKPSLTATSSGDPLRPGLPARRTAVRLLGAVTARRTPLDALTDDEHGHPQYLALEPRDRALVRAMLATALRHRGAIEAALGRLLDRPLPANAASLQAILHIAAAQVLYLDIPDHAAVDLAVAMAGDDPRARRFTGLVNAVLRRLAREKADVVACEPRTNVPAWFADMLDRAYGPDKADAILAIQASEPPIDLTVKHDPEAWAARLGGVALATGTVRLKHVDGPLTELPGFAEGEWWVQDAAASLPARLLGDVAGKDVADLCAAPGGKTAQLAQAGARVTAFDMSASRLARLESNLARLNLPAMTVKADLLRDEHGQTFDAVLLDAPCSSTGTVRRHPDVPWTKTPEDIVKLAELQQKLLGRAARFVRSGGILVFSNCSLDPREGEEVARRFLAEAADFEAMPVNAGEVFGLSRLVTGEGFLRCAPCDMPHEDASLAGMDGFFAARFRRVLSKR